MKNIVIAILVALMICPVPQVRAGGCRYSNSCYYTPQVETVYVDRIVPVAYPVPFTVAVPVVSYLYNGGYGVPGYSPVLAAQPATGVGQVQVAPVQQVQPQAQAQPQSNGAPKTSAMMQLSDNDIDYLISRIEQRLSARATNGGGTQPQNMRPNTTSPPPPVPQDNKQSSNITDADVIRVLTTKLGSSQKSCADCHTGTAAKGGIRIFDGPGILNPRANWSKVWDAADAGRMPKEAQTNKNAVLADADCDVLRSKMMQVRGN